MYVKLARALRQGLLLLAACSLPAQAAMVLSQTRVVLASDAPRAELLVRNVDRQPLLLQAWVDVGSSRQAQTTPAQQATPFLIDPPVLRIEPGEVRSLRVLLVNTPADLPPDRETLFWLNLLEVAAMPALAEQDARLDVSVLSRLKLFYRPASMLAAPLPALRFAVAREGQDRWLAIHNPAPVHQTLGSLTLHADDALLTLDAPMIAPFDNARVRLPPAALSRTPSTGCWLKFTLIDDDGNGIAHEQALSTQQNASLAARDEGSRRTSACH